MRNDRIARLLIGGAIGLATILALSWFFRNYELATREETTGYSQEARRNPLLAAERFLRRIGVETVAIGNTELWRQMPASNDTLIVYRYQPPASEQRRQQLRNWVESGGHLIVEADHGLIADGDTPIKSRGLLADLGVRLHEREFNSDEDAEYQTQLLLHFRSHPAPVHVNISNYYYLEDTAHRAVVRVPLTSGYALLQYEVGNGLVTVLNDNYFLSNSEIDGEEHSLALAHLVGEPHQGKVWLMHDMEVPSLLELGWHYLPYAVVASAVALVLWLWQLSTRLGPLLPPVQPPRRDIGEHLAATANYFWRLDEAQQLYRRNRDQIQQAWLHKHYTLRHMTTEERIAWMAARAGLPARAVERALAGDFISEADFIQLSGYLQKLRNSV